MRDIRIHQTGEPAVVEASDGRLTLSVPIQIKRGSGRKLVTLPNGEPGPVRPWDTAPTALQLALARGHRWLVLRTSGKVKSLREIARWEGVDSSYVVPEREIEFFDTSAIRAASSVAAFLVFAAHYGEWEPHK